MNGGADCGPDLYTQLNGKGLALGSVSALIDSSKKRGRRPARHAGHADLIRERIDNTIGYLPPKNLPY